MATKILTYDIPESVSFPNPSGLLRRRGIRFNYSCWIMDENRVPWNLVQRMKDAGVRRVYVVPGFDTNDTDAQQLMMDAIVDDVRKQQAKDLVTLRKQDEALQRVIDENNGEETIEVVRAREKHRKARANCLKGTEKLLKDLEYAMSLYKLDRSQVPFADARRQIAGIEALNGAQASLYAQATAAVANTEVGVAAAQDEMPAPILADYLDDQGNEELANQLRNAHAEAPAPRISNGNGREPVQYTVRTRQGVRRVWSAMTHREAALICRESESEFPADLASRYLAGRRLSNLQLSWLHVLAHEEEARRNPQPAPAAVPAPAAAQITAPKVQEPTPAAPVPPPPAPRAADDMIPGEILANIEVPLISTEGMAYSGGVFTISEAACNLTSLPRLLDVRSHKTGKTVRFTRSHEDWNQDEDGSEELVATVYSRDGKLTLRVIAK